MSRENKPQLPPGYDSDGNGDVQLGWYLKGDGDGLGLPFAYDNELRRGDGGACVVDFSAGWDRSRVLPAPPYAYRAGYDWERY